MDIKEIVTEEADVILFMKIGYHINEELEDIINRKKKEEQETGAAWWGYGGNICHPFKQVQRIAQNVKPIKVCFSRTKSRYGSPNAPLAKKYLDNDKNKPINIPEGIEVRGSKYALILSKLQKVDEELNLSDYKVVIGDKKGKLLLEYIRLRVDKGIGIKFKDSEEKPVKIQYTAELVEPFAVCMITP